MVQLRWCTRSLFWSAPGGGGPVLVLGTCRGCVCCPDMIDRIMDCLDLLGAAHGARHDAATKLDSSSSAPAAGWTTSHPFAWAIFPT